MFSAIIYLFSIYFRVIFSGYLVQFAFVAVCFIYEYFMINCFPIYCYQTYRLDSLLRHQIRLRILVVILILMLSVFFWV